MESIWNSSNIRTARKAIGISGIDAAKVLSITPEYLSMVESGSNIPSQKLIAKMAGLYNQPLAFFLIVENNFENNKELA